jgi:hypothetical protein
MYPTKTNNTKIERGVKCAQYATGYPAYVRGSRY